jgi:hypothetical protein
LIWLWYEKVHKKDKEGDRKDYGFGFGVENYEE